MASGLLMPLTVYPVGLLPKLPLKTVRIDPTRLAQGIMTGNGFLGAGVSMKGLLTIRGLTIVGSIWITAAIGILIGIGFYFAAAAATLLTLGVAVAVPLDRERAALALVRAARGRHARRRPPVARGSYASSSRGTAARPLSRAIGSRTRVGPYRYEITLRTRNRENYRRLADALAAA